MSPTELDLFAADLQDENRQLRQQRDAALEEAIHLRHTLEHIYAKAHLAVREGRPSNSRSVIPTHADKASY
jgi:hypothetical protein